MRVVSIAVCLFGAVSAFEFNELSGNDAANAPANVIAPNTNTDSGSAVWEADSDMVDATTSGGFRVGTTNTLNPQEYAITTPCERQEWTIADKKAASLWLEFASISLAPGDQLVLVSSKNGQEVTIDPTPNGANASIITPPISGNQVTLQYRPSPTCSPNGGVSFSLVRAGVKFTKEWFVQKEAVCGSADTMKNAKCFAESGIAKDREMYAKASAVLRTERTRDDGAIVVCTAWLWGKQGYLVTNNHCFSSQEMVNKASFQFGSETATCGGKCNPGQCPVALSVNGATGIKFIASDPDLDIALLQLTRDVDAIVSRFGFLQIRFGYPKLGEQIYIPQHPAGGPRKIAKTDDDRDATIATIKQLDYAVKVQTKVFKGLIGYTADTESGSSGSPIISRVNHQVIGLHRIGFCNNAATPSQQLLAYLIPLVNGDASGLVA